VVEHAVSVARPLQGMVALGGEHQSELPFVVGAALRLGGGLDVDDAGLRGLAQQRMALAELIVGDPDPALGIDGRGVPGQLLEERAAGPPRPVRLGGRGPGGRGPNAPSGWCRSAPPLIIAQAKVIRLEGRRVPFAEAIG